MGIVKKLAVPGLALFDGRQVDVIENVKVGGRLSGDQMARVANHKREKASVFEINGLLRFQRGYMVLQIVNLPLQVGGKDDGAAAGIVVVVDGRVSERVVAPRRMPCRIQN